MWLAEHVHRLGTAYINWYIVEDGGRLTVLDSGPPGYHGQLQPELARIGRTVADIEAVVLTHYHVDHAGGAAAITTEAGAPVYVHQDDAPFLRGDAPRHRPNLPLYRPWMLKYGAHLVGHGARDYPPVADPTTFGDGEVLDIPGRPRVIHAPGHTPGCCVLHIPQLNVLFTGDVLVTLDTANGRVGPTVANDIFNTDSREAADSLHRLEGLEARMMLPGHGEPWEGGGGGRRCESLAPVGQGPDQMARTACRRSSRCRTPKTPTAVAPAASSRQGTPPRISSGFQATTA